MQPASNIQTDSNIGIAVRYGIVAGMIAVAIVGALILLKSSIGNRFEAGSGDLTIPASVA